MRFRPFLALGIVALGTCPVVAQPQPRYEPFPFDLNAEALVLDRLNQLKNLQQAREFIDKVLRDSNKLHLDAKTRETLKHLNLDDPRLQESLKPWMEKIAQGNPPVPPNDLPKFEEAVKKVAEAQKTPTPSRPQSLPPDAASVNPQPTPAAPPMAPEVPNAPNAEAGVRDWLKDVMERAENSDFGEWLRESPAFQKALQDLHGTVRMPEVQPNGWGLDRLFKLDKLSMPDGTAFEKLGQFKPNLPHIDPPALPSLGRPSLPPMSAPSVPTMSSLGTLATWLLCLVLVALFVWQASRWINLPGRGARDAAAAFGPWPVQPGAVSTRTDLVRAYDHLALLLLGPRARTWHHHAVAQALGQRGAACVNVAVQLTLLYEKARYTEGAETLAPDDRDRVRAALVHLAGGDP